MRSFSASLAQSMELKKGWALIFSGSQSLLEGLRSNSCISRSIATYAQGHYLAPTTTTRMAKLSCNHTSPILFGGLSFSFMILEYMTCTSSQ